MTERGLPYKEIEKEGLQEETFPLQVKAGNYSPMEKQLWKSAGYSPEEETWKDGRRVAMNNLCPTFRNFVFMLKTIEKH